MSAGALLRLTGSIANATPRDGDRSAMTADAMTRRRLVPLLVLGLLAAPLAAEAQPAGKVYRVRILWAGGVPDPSVATAPNLVPMALRELGYVDGRNLVVERRFAAGKIDRLPGLARELVQLQADVILAAGVEAVQAARDTTATIPIVMMVGIDPVARGWVASLSRPGGNITGVTVVAETVLAGKRLELIREAVPGAARIGVLTPRGPGSSAQLQEAEKAASALRVKLVVVEVQGTDYDRAFATMVAGRPDALFVLMSPILTRDRKQIIERAATHRLPAIYEWREQVEAGGLMSYGGSLVEISRRIAAYIDKIFKGAKAADLPVEQPTKFELVINLKTAKALGLTIPPSLLLRADQVIE
jgi:putative ABC transport system substrate-binding protein